MVKVASPSSSGQLDSDSELFVSDYQRQFARRLGKWRSAEGAVGAVG